MKREFYAVLDNLRSLHNVGSIFRTAEALGFKKIFLGGITTDLNSSKARREIAKTALGAENYLAWEKVKQTWRILKKLKQEGFYLIGLEITPQALPLNKVKLPKNYKKFVLVVGNEIKGLSPQILSYCQKVVKIPLKGRKESLNVGVAFGIAAFWLSNL